MSIPTANQINEITVKYLEAYDVGRYADASRANQHSIFATRFEKTKRVYPKSIKYSFNFMDQGYSNFEYVGYDDEAEYTRSAIGAKGEVTVGMSRTHMMVNRAEPAFESGGKTEIINYLHYETQNMYDRWYEEADRRLFQLATAPNDGTTSARVKPHALTYWIVEPDSNSDGAFLSDSTVFSDPHPSGYSSVATIDRSIARYSGIANWGFTFDRMSIDDGLLKMFRASGKCNFRPYYTVSSRNASEIQPSNRYLIISDHETFLDYQQNASGLNDNFGVDAGKFQKSPTSGVWAGHEWIWAPDDSLGSTSGTVNQRVLGLDLDTWEIVQYGDWFMKKDAPFTLQANPLMQVTNMYSSWTSCCKSPRNNFHAVPTI